MRFVSVRVIGYRGADDNYFEWEGESTMLLNFEHVVTILADDEDPNTCWVTHLGGVGDARRGLLKIGGSLEHWKGRLFS